MKSKICGISDKDTLMHLTNHPYPPDYIGFVINYKKSKRFINQINLKELLKIKKKKSKYVAVLVNPKNYQLEKISKLPFDYYQLYKVSPKKTKIIKKIYKKKIITALTIENSKHVKKYKDYQNISDIILFDSKGYEKSMSFDHSLLKKIPNSINKMIAGNIKYNEKLDKYSKIADIIDLSGSLETSGKKDVSKINIFLKNLKKTNDKN